MDKENSRIMGLVCHIVGFDKVQSFGGFMLIQILTREYDEVVKCVHDKITIKDDTEFAKYISKEDNMDIVRTGHTKLTSGNSMYFLYWWYPIGPNVNKYDGLLVRTYDDSISANYRLLNTHMLTPQQVFNHTQLFEEREKVLLEILTNASDTCTMIMWRTPGLNTGVLAMVDFRVDSLHREQKNCGLKRIRLNDGQCKKHTITPNNQLIIDMLHEKVLQEDDSSSCSSNGEAKKRKR